MTPSRLRGRRVVARAEDALTCPTRENVSGREVIIPGRPMGSVVVSPGLERSGQPRNAAYQEVFRL